MPALLSHKNQSIDLHSKSIDWFLYEGNTGLTKPHLFSLLKVGIYTNISNHVRRKI